MKMALKSALLLSLVGTALAQNRYDGHGYVSFGVNGANRKFGQILSVGGGGEGFVWRGLAVGADLSYVYPRQCFGEGIGLLSVGPSYHLLSRAEPRRFVPFVTGGYSLGFRSGTANMFHYGGGATWWFHNRLGLRAELRDHRDAKWPGDHFYAMRFSLAFR